MDSYAPALPFLDFMWMFLKQSLKASLIPFLLVISFAGVGSKVRFVDIAKLGMKPFAALMAVLAGVLALGMAIVIAPYIA